MFGIRLWLPVLCVSLCLGLGWGAEAAWGEEPDDSVAREAAAPEHSVRDLIRQLDADEFAQREDASRRLKDLGAAAVPELAQAAQGSSLEASARAFAILKQFISDDDPKLQAAAREALGSIAAQREAAEKNKNDALASAAAKAKEILGDAQPKHAGQPSVAMPIPGGIPFGGPRPMIVPGRRIVGNSISVRVVDGTREVDVEENQNDGQKRSVKMVSDPKSGIRIEVTTTRNGKPVTEKYAAKDAESLKKDHPEAYKIYEQYNGTGGAVQIGGGQIHIHGGRIEIGGGGGIRVVPQPRLAPGPEMGIEAEIERQLRQLMEANAFDETILQALEKQRAALREQRRVREQQRRLPEEGQGKEAESQPAKPAPPPAPARKPAQVEADLFGP